MTEIEKNINEEVNDTQKYIDTINELKASTVSREAFERVKEENRTLLKSIVDGRPFETSSPEEAGPTIDELRNTLYGNKPKHMTDLEYVTGVLDLRDKLLEAEGVDHFIPSGKKYSPDYNDQYVAQRTYEGLRHCVEVANGDNDVFIQEITRITADTGLPRVNKILRK